VELLAQVDFSPLDNRRQCTQRAARTQQAADGLEMQRLTLDRRCLRHEESPQFTAAEMLGNEAIAGLVLIGQVADGVPLPGAAAEKMAGTRTRHIADGDPMVTG